MAAALQNAATWRPCQASAGNPMICTACGRPMNEHAEDVDFSPSTSDPVSYGAIEQIHSCARCGNVQMRAADASPVDSNREGARFRGAPSASQQRPSRPDSRIYGPNRMSPQNLRVPGPTPLPPAVREALGRDMINHRGPQFAGLMRDCVDGLKWAYQISEHDVVILTSSGTGVLESIVTNTLSPAQRMLVASIGNFGERMGKIARAFGVDVLEVDAPPGEALDPQHIEDLLRKEPGIDTVFFTHNETSTGVLNPLERLAGAVRRVRPEALILVDGISSVGSVEIRPEAWGCDVVAAGSQKGWMAPPGLGFVSISPRAWERQKRSTLPRMYFDWAEARKAAEHGETPWTPAVSLFYALQVGLRLMRDEGLEHIFSRHRRLAEYTRHGLADLDIKLLADPHFASPTVTTAWLPEGVNGKALLNALEQHHGVVLAGGQGSLSGKIVRIGHLGWVDQADLDAVVDALQVELHRAGTAGAVR